MLMDDSAYGSAEMLGWLVHEHGIEEFITTSPSKATGYSAITSPVRPSTSKSLP